MKTKIFSIGGATFDMFVRTNDHSLIQMRDAESCKDWLCFEHGGKVKVNEVEETFGGGAANTAVAFSKLGFDASFLGKVGFKYGNQVIENLNKQGVNTAFARKTKKDKTGFSVILNTFKGDRTVLAYSGANQYFSAIDLPIKELKTANWIFLNHLSEKNTKIPQLILKVLKKNPNIKLAWNPGLEQLKMGAKKCKGLLSQTEVLILNKEEASLFAKKPYQIAETRKWNRHMPTRLKKRILPHYADDVSEIIVDLLNTGLKKVVITDGRNGAQASDGKWLYFCPAITSKRVDTLGAGDAFGSGFVGGLIRHEDLKIALKYGTLNANSVVHVCGAQNGLLTLNKINEKLKTIDISVLRSKINALS